MYMLCSVCCNGEEERERSEVSNDPICTAGSTPDNDTSTGTGERGNDSVGKQENECTGVRHSDSLEEQNNDSFSNQHSDRRNYGITGHVNRTLVESEHGGMGDSGNEEQENGCAQLFQLQKQVHCYQRHLAELEEEV